MLGERNRGENQREREDQRLCDGLHGLSPVWVVFLSVLTQLCSELRQPKGQGRYFVVGQVFMSGHIGSGNSEPGDLRKAMDALGGRTRRGQIEEWPNRKIGRQPLEVSLPDQARAPAGAVACGAVTAKEPFTVVGIGLRDGGR